MPSPEHEAMVAQICESYGAQKGGMQRALIDDLEIDLSCESVPRPDAWKLTSHNDFPHLSVWEVMHQNRSANTLTKWFRFWFTLDCYSVITTVTLVDTLTGGQRALMDEDLCCGWYILHPCSGDPPTPRIVTVFDWLQLLETRKAPLKG